MLNGCFSRPEMSAWMPPRDSSSFSPDAIRTIRSPPPAWSCASRRVIDSSYSFLVGPLVAAGALGVILLMCRWVFSTTHRDDRTARRLDKARARGDYGLLVQIAQVRTLAAVVSAGSP